MIDITKVQAYDIPPEISELQNKNFQLQNKYLNRLITRQKGLKKNITF